MEMFDAVNVELIYDDTAKLFVEYTKKKNDEGEENEAVESLIIFLNQLCTHNISKEKI